MTPGTPSPRFLVCIHDVTPAWTREIRLMIRDLGPVLGHRLCCGVVPNWHGDWPLTRHPDFCRFVQASSEELLLHGYFHRRQWGHGPVTFLAEGGDEMNALDPDGTRRILELGQRVFTDVFGAPARGFLAPAWQQGHVESVNGRVAMLAYVLGFFSLKPATQARIPLATWSWDCGRWGWLGHIGHGIGSLRHAPERVPVLAIHPRDLDRGFWPAIMRQTRQLVDAGFEPSTPTALLQARDAEAAA